MKVALGIVALVGTTAATAQQPTFSSRVDAVRVDVLVTDRGQVVRGLRPQDFELKDEGVVQDVDFVSLEQLPLNVILGLDVSKSVSGERLNHLRSAGDALLQRLTGADRGALLTFSHVVRLRHELTGDIARLRQALAEVTPLDRPLLWTGPPPRSRLLAQMSDAAC